jgi:hypothetical protein
MRRIVFVAVALAFSAYLIATAHAQQVTKPPTPPEKMGKAPETPPALRRKLTETGQVRRHRIRHIRRLKCDPWMLATFGTCT